MVAHMVQIICPELYPQKFKYLTPEREKYIRENYGMDVMMQAKDLKLNWRTIHLLQRRLGLRKCRNPTDKED